MKPSLLVCLLAVACSEPVPTTKSDGNDTGVDAGVDAPSEAEPECVNPTDCPIFSTCRDGICVPTPCQADADCGRGNRCREGSCVEIGAAACEEDADCGYRWACSATGVCTDSECAVHADCPSHEWCRTSICVDKHDVTGDVDLRRTHLPPLTEHSAGEFDALYGWGGALVDYDGDGDLDIFLGTSDRAGGDSPACLYENRSSAGDAQFSVVDDWCGEDLDGFRFGTAIDTDRDGAHEIILAGRRALRWIRFREEVRQVDLLALLPDADPRRQCDAGAAVATDLDFDGHLDLLVGCTRRRTDEVNPDGYPNLALRYDPIGDTFEPMEDPLLADLGYTLAIAVHDTDRDGLPDLLLANDTFTARDESANFLPPGSVLFACAPHTECSYEPVPFDEDDRAWGSFMGLGAVHIDGIGEHIYISDFGPNRLIGFDGRMPTDRAPDLGAELAVSDPGQFLLYGWAVLIDDFDRNGLEDILVTQGHPKGGVDAIEYEVQQDYLLLQTTDGLFVTRGPESGLSAPNIEDSRDAVHAYSSRGGVRFDMDHDGWLDVLTTGLTGYAKLHVEQPTEDNGPDRCTLRPVSTVVPSLGHSVGVAAEGTTDFRYREVQGQIRWGTSPWLTTTERRGVVRFPSGAHVPFDCDTSNGPVDVVEPAWVQVVPADGTLEITLDAPWLENTSVEAAVSRGDGPGSIRLLRLREDGVWTLEIEEGDVRAMLRIDGFWLPRWWTWQ